VHYLLTIIMGTSAVIFSFCIGFFFQNKVPRSVTDRWFLLRSFEKDGKAYKILGIKLFKDFLIRTGYNDMLAKGLKVSNSSKLELRELILKMQQAELIHLLGLGIAFAIAFISLIVKRFDLFVTINLLNIPLNLYPVFLQRYNRLRINHILRNKL